MSDLLELALFSALLFIGIVALSLSVTWLMACWLQSLSGEQLPLDDPNDPIEWCGQIIPAGELVPFAPRDPDTRAEAAPVVRALPPETLIEIGPTVFTAHEIEQLACVRRDREWW